jgi:ferritin
MKHNKMQAALNKQINAEMYSAYLYLSMSAYFEEQSLKGFAHWMKIQAKEEMEHAMKFYNYIHERRWQVKLTAIATPKSTWSSPLAAIEDAFAHEKKITANINSLMDLAVSSKDYASQSMLQWFVDEQVEEENNADDIVQRLKLINKHQGMLMMLDAELGKRE